VEGAKLLTVRSEGDFSVTDGAGTVHKLAAGTYSLRPDLTLTPPDAAAEPLQLTGPLVFRRGKYPVGLAHLFRGSIEIDSAKGKLQAINTVPLEGYLYGVVPQEMPDAWPAQALQAQAVVARSYALSHRTGGSFDVYGDQRSQVYGGIAAESPAATAAVDATRAQVVTYDGKVATTPYFSTSGGRTASAAEVWGGGKAPPYLVSVPDPYDTLSPYHNWGPVGFTGARVAKLLAVPGPVVDLRTTLWPDGRVRTLTAISADGSETDVPGTTVRSGLGLRSTWITIGTLSLVPPDPPLVYGSGGTLTGVVRGISDAQLEERTGSAPWEATGSIAATKAGAFSTDIQPTATTQYRLTSGTVHSGALRVPVAAAVQLSEASTGLLEGSCQPAVDGAAVQLQRQRTSGGWTTDETLTAGPDGQFSAESPVTAGTYRARCAPGQGVVAGASEPVQVLG
jgi:stage II sporulation protein D